MTPLLPHVRPDLHATVTEILAREEAE